MTEIDIKADDGCVRIQVFGYERTEIVDEFDGDWLKCLIYICIPPFTGEFEASFEFQDFFQLYETLGIVYEKLDGEALFSPIEEAISLKFAVKSRGKVEVNGAVNPAFPSCVALRFVLHSDQTMLNEVIGSLKTVLRQYPSRRKSIP